MTPQELDAIRRDFIPLQGPQAEAWLDNAAGTLVPRPVLDAWRGVYEQPGDAGERFEAARKRLRRFFRLGAAHALVFTRNSTEALNLAAFGLAQRVGEGQRILLSEAEHPSNVLPWQRLAEARGASLDVIPLRDDGTLDGEALAAHADDDVAILAITHTANATGMRPDLARLAAWAKARGALVVVDAAQAPAHVPVDLEAWGADLACVSAQKIFAPRGCGALLGRRAILETLAPLQLGGGMCGDLRLADYDPLPLPARLEGGSQDIAAAVAWARAADWIEAIGWDRIRRHEAVLSGALDVSLARVPGLRVLPHGNDRAAAPIRAFTIDGEAPAAAALRLEQAGVRIRAGTLTAPWTLRRFGLTAACRVSCCAYNTEADIARLEHALRDR